MKIMHNSGPVDYHSLLGAVVSGLLDMTITIDAHWVLHLLTFLTTATALVINVLKLVDWIQTKFKNKKP